VAEVFNNIRAECARQRITIEQLTDMADINRKTFYNWEKKGDLPVSMLDKIATVLNTTTDKILGLK
jgi:transcriptional regulator with XRE-family HTH domain